MLSPQLGTCARREAPAQRGTSAGPAPGSPETGELPVAVKTHNPSGGAACPALARGWAVLPGHVDQTFTPTGVILLVVTVRGARGLLDLPLVLSTDAGAAV